MKCVFIEMVQDFTLWAVFGETVKIAQFRFGGDWHGTKVVIQKLLNKQPPQHHTVHIVFPSLARIYVMNGF